MRYLRLKGILPITNFNLSQSLKEKSNFDILKISCKLYPAPTFTVHELCFAYLKGLKTNKLKYYSLEDYDVLIKFIHINDYVLLIFR